MLAAYGLGTTSLHNKDEALHALVTADLVASGDWLDLTLEGEPYLSKPPLRFWLTAPLVRMFGFNAWTVRFWSTAFGVATVVLLYWGVARRWGQAAGAWSALALATSHHFLYSHATRSGELDTTLLFFWTASAFALAEAAVTRRPGWLVVAGALAGTAGMSKHLLFLPELALIAGLCAALGVGRGLPARWWAAAAAAGLVVALPWHLAQWLRHGDAFLATYFGTEVAGRLSGTAPGGAAGHGPLFYLRELALGFFPWSLLLPIAVPRAARRARDGDPLGTVLLIWGLVALIVPSAATSKLPWYVLPALPAAAALVGWLLAAWVARAPHLAADLAIGAALALALLSPTNAADHNPFARDAVFGGLTVDWLGRG
ncbi:MAG: ArnT family glycosyltransferase, partial [Thermoanaerobaculia bacterium]